MNYSKIIKDSFRFKRVITLIFMCVFCLGVQTTYADLTPPQLSVKLSISKHNYIKNEVVQFTLTFINHTDKKRPILLPGSKNSGLKIISFSYYSVQDDFYTEVYRESLEIDMDSVQFGDIDFRYLNPYDSISIPIFLNDTANFRNHIEANHMLPNLESGDYQVRVWYDPWNDTMSQYAFIKIPLYQFSTQVMEEDPFKFNIPEEGMISNLVTITISKDVSQEENFVTTNFCRNDCKFCQTIEDEDWDKVETIIHDQTFYNGTQQAKKVDSMWLQPHRNVAWVYHWPGSFLSSLPSYTYRRIVFRNSKGYHYYRGTWQLGIVYPTRSRIKSWTYWMGRSGAPIKTSEVDYMKLVLFESY